MLMPFSTPSMSDEVRAAGEGGVVAVVLPRAEADPHGTLRLASANYRAAIEAIGFRSLSVDLDRFGPAEFKELRAIRLHAVFSDGGWVNSVRIEDHDGVKPLSERLGAPVVALINDSPCSPWMPLVIGRDSPTQTTAFLDSDFSRLWQRWAPKCGSHRVYVPACPPMPDPPSEAGRDIAVLTAVTFRPPEEFRSFARDRCPDRSTNRLYDAIVETGLSETLSPYSSVCDAVCGALGIQLDFERPEHRLLLCLADHHIRNERRRRMIDRLADRPITLVGSADGLRLHPDSQVLPAVPHAELMMLYRRARIVVACPPYSGGVSERVTHPMAAGAVVVAPPTILSDRLFGRDRVFVTVAADFADLSDGLARADDPVIRRRILAAARVEVVERFTPEATMRSLLPGLGTATAMGGRV
ncbi:glycosyltransferase family protein [Azospirillum agricola]|uniref:glycosyltransferase family protein n=1 Tax=Azospirillum agricola TaxID=1720247 RepID=UPI000A0F389B|nr:glycosyltransferase [Azospirillum agricola]SMH62283.1 Glycosyl transferases group 1 [Azospirillum lipoferum]